MTAPAGDPRGGEACKGTIWPSWSHRWIPCPGVMRNSQCNAYGSQHASVNAPPPAAGRGDTDSVGQAIEPGLSAEANARRLKWFTDAELDAELNRRRALDGA